MRKSGQCAYHVPKPVHIAQGGQHMIPLVSTPDFVRQYARQYADLLSPDLLDHFERFLSGIFVCERRNIETINDAFVVAVKNQSSANRFLTEYDWSTKELNERRLKLLREDPQTCPRRSGVLALDDTYTIKQGEHFAGAGYYYLPSKKFYSWAHNIVTLHYADTVCDYPLEYALYEQTDVDEAVKLLDEHGGRYNPEVLARKTTATAKRRYIWPKLRAVKELEDYFPSKIQLACRLVDWADEHGFYQPYVFDSWYTCKELCQHISQKGRDWIGTTDASDGIYWRGKWHNLGEWVASRPDREFVETSFQYHEQKEVYYVGSWVAPIGKLGRVRLVASYKKADRTDKPKFFPASKLTWECKHILQRRRRRWTVETAYEDFKGPLGFDEYELRDIDGIKRHWYLVFAAYSASRAATAQGRFGKWVNDHLFTVGDVCRQIQGEALAALVSFCATQTLAGEKLDSVLRHVLSHLAR
ncbi:MAG: transposase [Blastocatellia bacterium]